MFRHIPKNRKCYKSRINGAELHLSYEHCNDDPNVENKPAQIRTIDSLLWYRTCVADQRGFVFWSYLYVQKHLYSL